MEDKYNKITMRIIENITLIQGSKSYKITLASKRLLSQFIKGNKYEKNDFIKWILNKVSLEKNKYQVKGLTEFDPLENVKSDLIKIESNQNNKVSFLKKKNTRQVFIFDNLSYSDSFGKSRASQIAKAFNEIGLDVYFVFSYKRSRLIFEPITLAICLVDYNYRDICSMVKNNAIFLFFNNDKHFLPYVEFAFKNKICSFYEISSDYNQTIAEKVNYLLLNENISKSYISSDLYEKVINLNSAIDTQLFEPDLLYEKPIDVNVKNKGKRNVLIAGIKNEDIDYSIIKKLAKEHEDTEFYILNDKSINEEKIEKNIFFLGEKYQKDMPMYISYADLIILPFKSSATASEYVGTIIEMVGMKKRILLNAKFNIDMPNVITIISDKEWSMFLNEEGYLINSIDDFVYLNNWYDRCNRILNRVEYDDKAYNSISIIILNRNNMNVIIRCIESLMRYNTYKYEIIVVDNDSTDGSYEYLNEHYRDKIILIKNDRNGCSSGRNLGVKNSHGEYLYFLDSDQWVIGERWLDTALDIIEENPGLGSVGWNAGWFHPGKLTATIVDYLPNRGITPDILYRCDIGLLATSGMLMKRDLFNEVGGFDEFYDPTCFEDTDLSLKIRNSGYEIAYSPYTMLKHLPHQTTKSGSDWHTKLMERNAEYCKKKWEQIDKTLFEYYY